MKLFILTFLTFHTCVLLAATNCIAHRGSFKNSTENTIESMQEAFALGADGVEFDIQHTKDGYPLIMHDKKLTTATHLPGKVCPFEKKINELTLKTIQENCAIKFQNQFIPVPTLDELLAEVSSRDKFVFIELKDKPTRKTTQIIEDFFANASEKLRIIAFKVKHIKTLRQNGSANFWNKVKALDLNILPMRRHKEYGLNVWDKYFKLRKSKFYQNKKFETSVWTVSSEDKMKRFLQLDVDFITTNAIEKCQELKDEIQSSL